MISNKKIDLICLLTIGLCLVAAVILMVISPKQDNQAEEKTDLSNYISQDYVNRIFDDSYVHEIDIKIPKVNWKYMTEHATEEVYVICDVMIDGELLKDVAIRPKGNSSLSAIKTQGSDKFSFKIEFDHYKASNTYYGLDKLALNNLGQDVSIVKDYLTYHMMNEMGVAAPLSSYVMIKLNGEDFGLYLAVEAIEDSFAQRNYGTDYGNIYKPECFYMKDVTPKAFMNLNEDAFGTDFDKLGPGDRADILGNFIKAPFESAFGPNMEVAALHYVGEDISRYNVVFDSAVFDIDEGDKESFIHSVQKLNSQDSPEESIDTESVINFLVVHNFVNNYDSYSGIFVHNYYIREYDGKLSMIPWDYNLAFGIFTFQSAMKSFLGEDSPYWVDLKVGNAMSDGKGMVNYPIDTPTISVEMQERPLINVLLTDEEYLNRYHQAYSEFITDYFDSKKFDDLYSETLKLLDPYVKSGQTFYSYEQVRDGQKAIYDYCKLRAQSIRGQLDGTIPATMEGQSRDYENLVEVGDLDLSKSVTFDSLVFGIRAEDIVEILDAIAGDNTHDSQGFNQTINEVTNDSSKLPTVLGRVIESSSLIKKGIASALKGPLLLLISLIALFVGMKIVKNYGRDH